MVRRGGAMRRIGATGIGLALAASAAAPAFAVTENCFEPQVQKYTFDLAARKSVYTVFRSCFKYFQDSSQSSETFLVTSTGTWDANAGKATEVTDIHDKYYVGGVLKNDQHYAKTTSADCPRDPWQYQVDCTNNWLVPPTPIFWFSYPPYPITAQGISAANRNYLKAKLAALQRKAAPEILQPKPNGKYTNGQLLLVARVTVPDDDDPGAWRVEIETNMDPFQAAPHNIPLKAARVVTGLGTAWIYLDLPYDGFWYARARSTSAKHTSDWSNHVRFEIAGSKGLQFMTIPAQDLKFQPIGTSSTLGPPPLPGPSPAPSPAPAATPPQRRRSR
jgi:hypothetical protein